MEFRALSLCFLLLYVGYCKAISESDIEYYESYWRSIFPTVTSFPEVLGEFLPLGELQGVRSLSVDGRNDPPQPSKNILPQPWGAWASRYTQSQQHHFVSDQKSGSTSEKVRDYDGSDLTSYFFEEDLVVGKKMKMEFQKAVTKAKLLPRQVIESIPFSIKMLPEVLGLFKMNPESIDAKIVKETLQHCEGPLNPIAEVSQFCATSFESLIDYAVWRLGRNAQVYATKADSEEKKEYTIEENGVEMLGDKSISCHLQNYVHAVFYCHELKLTKAYRVSLVASDGSKAKAVVLCHQDTRGADPNDLPFRMLNVMPGDKISICHFLVRGSHAWVTNSVLAEA